jgi:hypothetical protein
MLFGCSPLLAIVYATLFVPMHPAGYRQASNQRSTAARLAEIHESIARYESTCHTAPPKGLKSISVWKDELVTCDPEVEPNSLPLEDSVSGYRYHATFDGLHKYEITASPTQPSVTGNLEFYMDQTGLIRGVQGRPAAANDQVWNMTEASRPQQVPLAH